MGKAGKWIRNLLVGTGTHAASVEEGPRVKRRWSFKRSHKTNKSFDSVEHGHNHNLVMPLLPSTNAAATKIQAAYRSYLARRALRALRGLVKLQALVKGYLVRKQMNYVVRSMHAVMAIQVRARMQRIQMADKPVKMSYKLTSASDAQIAEQIQENRVVHGTGEELTRRISERMDHRRSLRVEDYGCSRLSVSRREYELNPCPSPSALSLTTSSSMSFDGRQETMAPTNSKNLLMWHENKPFISRLAKCPDHVTSDSSFVPNYMSTTNSSKAKARSHSEPKQRPLTVTDQKRIRSSSMDWKGGKNQRHWSIKIYRSSKSTDDKTKSLIPFEARVLAFSSYSFHDI
ncbi:protein IQ-DOMAIN 1-like [Dorcoceras hygrometricum]|uniref:Protein IQ-DOMAIN 1-like n=1 Tax=Dorcoceras hygrometricum TaxID=472368 RepID=A0A2Z7D793_9LAMI|nr:protein IQ-DOMAIN 1-like [Dorcoceras hygrometricum]